jgi:hypothetical protein
MRITIRTSPNLGDKAAQLRQLAETGVYESLGRSADAVRDVILFALKDEAPVKTGELRDSLDAKQSTSYAGGIRLEFTADAPHTKYVIGGTKPHEILPRNAKALAFYGSDGELHFAKRVQHPGTQPNPFHERAWDRAKDDVFNILLQTAREIAVEVAS